MESASSSIRQGSKIGRFVVVAELGSGGMGVVYCAHDRELDRQVALKVMRGTGEDEYEDRMRMLREGQAMARVTHPNVITVYEVGTEGGTVFLAQELLDGGSLAKWLETPHELPEILEKFVAAGRGLAAAHAAGLVHRDFKPDNVLLGKDGRVRVSDFGLARALGMSDLAGPTNRGGGPPVDTDVTKSPMSQLTRTGAVMGTPMFMAPEQHEGRRADERSDQFAFCVALWHAVYGEWPFAGKTAISLADNVINGVMQEPPKAKKIPARLKKLLVRGLSIDPTARYPSMDALLADLAAPQPAGKKLALVAGGLAVVAGAAIAFALLRGGGEPAPKVVDEVKPTPVVTKGDLTIDDDGALTEALDKGSLRNATKAYELDAKVAQDASRAAIAQAAVAFTLALAGDLPGAEAKQKEAEAKKGNDPRAAAFVDMAAAAIAAGRGEPRTALEHAHRCATAFAKPAPVMAAICYQLKGEAAADIGNIVDAHAAFDSGLAIAKSLDNTERIATLSLAKLQLGFDAQQHEVPLEPVLEHLQAAKHRRAASCEANAAVLASRIRALKAENDAAIADLEALNLGVLQVYRLHAMARIAIGEVYGYKNEGDKDGVMGLDHIEDAIDDAKKKGYWGIELEGKLARVRVMLTLGHEEAEAERTKLIGEANARGYVRIARLAEKFDAKLEVPKPAEKPAEQPTPP